MGTWTCKAGRCKTATPPQKNGFILFLDPLIPALVCFLHYRTHGEEEQEEESKHTCENETRRSADEEGFRNEKKGICRVDDLPSRYLVMPHDADRQPCATRTTCLTCLTSHKKSMHYRSSMKTRKPHRCRAHVQTIYRMCVHACLCAVSWAGAGKGSSSLPARTPSLLKTSTGQRGPLGL